METAAQQPTEPGAAPGSFAANGPIQDANSYARTQGDDTTPQDAKPLLEVTATFQRFPDVEPGKPHTANRFVLHFTDSEVVTTGFDEFPEKKRHLLRAAMTVLQAGQQLVEVVQENAIVLRTLIHEQIREIPEGSRFYCPDTRDLMRVGKVADCVSNETFGSVRYRVRVYNEADTAESEAVLAESFILRAVKDDELEERWPVKEATIQEATDEDVVDAYRLAWASYNHNCKLYNQLGDEPGLEEACAASERSIGLAYAELERRGKLHLIESEAAPTSKEPAA